MGLKYLLFQLAHFSLDVKHIISMRWLAIQIKAVATFLKNFKAHMNILFIIKVKIFMLVKWSYRSCVIW